MCHVGALSKALGILVWILGPESTVARIFISMKNFSMCAAGRPFCYFGWQHWQLLAGKLRVSESDILLGFLFSN